MTFVKLKISKKDLPDYFPPEWIRVGLQFKDRRSSDNFRDRIITLARSKDISLNGDYEEFIDLIGGGWTFDFLQRELSKNGCLEFVGHMDL